MTNDTPKRMPDNIPPFVKFCCANVPAVFDDSLSYYEALCALWKYLQDCINVINNNAMLEEEYIEKFNILKEYVEHYFDNLDVQEEINNKLEEMLASGDLANLLQVLMKQETDKLDNQLDEFENLINGQMATLNTKVDNSVTSTPLVADNVEGMTETDRIYVNTTDGHWYYYNGSQWQDGGTYQSTGIADGAISVFKLDDMLSTEFIKEYENVSYTPNLQGFCRIVSGSVYIDTSNIKWTHAVVTLDNDTVYEFSGFNYYAVVGLIITNSSDEVIYSTRDQSTTSEALVSVNLRFKTNAAGMRAYISIPTSDNTSVSDFSKYSYSLIKFKEISQNYKENTLTSLTTYDGVFGSILTNVNSKPYFSPSGEHYHVKTFKLNKGVKYKASSINYSYINGIIITDDKYIVSYSSSSSDLGERTPVTHEFTPSVDGYIFLSYDDRHPLPSLIIESALNTSSNRFYGKTWCAMGDSLTDPTTLGSSVDNYVNYVSDELGLTALNYGRGGTGYKASANNFVTVSTTLSSPDVITIFGSFNDTYGTLDTYGWGNITDHNTTTICGSMNTCFDNLITNYPNAVIGVIIPTPWKNRNSVDTSTSSDPDATERAEKYVEKLKAICELRSIPYLDLYTKSNLYPWDVTFRDLFFKDGDGTHPNTYGHKKISGQITEFIRSLLI